MPLSPPSIDPAPPGDGRPDPPGPPPAFDAERFRRWYGHALRAWHVGHFERNLDTGAIVWDAGCHAIWDWPTDRPPPALVSLADRILQADRDRFFEVCDADPALQDSGEHTVRLHSFAGRWKQVRTLWSVHRSPAGHRIVNGNLLDVTDAALAAQQAERRAQQVDLALQLAQVGLVELDLDGGALKLSDTARSILDLPDAEPAVLDDLLRRIDPDDMPRVMAEIARARDEPGRVSELHFRLNQGNQPARRVRARMAVRLGPDGTGDCLLASLIDETDSALHATRERELAVERELALDVAGLGTFRAQPLGTDWYDFDARQSAIYGLGFEPRRVHLQEWLACIHPDDRDALRDIDQAIQSDRMMFGRIRFRIMRPSGDVRWLEVSFRRSDNRPGEPRSLQGTTLDVTDRERAHQRLGALFEHTLSGLVLLDDQARCLDVNPAACAMCGHPREALIGRLLLPTLAPAPSRHDPRESWLTFLEAGQRRGVLTLRAAGDRHVTLDYAAVAHIQPGVHLVSLNDATARLAAEARLREVAARQQDEFDAFRAEIARDVHDQLGQTLGVLMFEVGVLGMRTGVDVRDLQSLLQDAVVVTRELSRALRPATLDLGLVPALGELASGIVQRTDVDVQVTAQPGLPELPLPVVAAVYRIAQEALTNVVKHAGSPRATIVVDTVTTPDDGDQLRVCIADDGRGFDPQVPATPEAAAGGGLGLLGMSERALQIGGRLKVDSAPGAGCRTVLLLPLPATRPIVA